MYNLRITRWWSLQPADKEVSVVDNRCSESCPRLHGDCCCRRRTERDDGRRRVGRPSGECTKPARHIASSTPSPSRRDIYWLHFAARLRLKIDTRRPIELGTASSRIACCCCWWWWWWQAPWRRAPSRQHQSFRHHRGFCAEIASEILFSPRSCTTVATLVENVLLCKDSSSTRAGTAHADSEHVMYIGIYMTIVLLQSYACTVQTWWRHFGRTINTWGRAVTATTRVHRWRIVERPLDIKVSCEMSRFSQTNKQTNSDGSTRTRMQLSGGACCCHEKSSFVFDSIVTWRV